MTIFEHVLKETRNSIVSFWLVTAFWIAGISIQGLSSFSLVETTGSESAKLIYNAQNKSNINMDLT